MRRISTNMNNNDMQYQMRIREWKMNRTQNMLANQSRIENLRDDPLAVSRAARFSSKIFKSERFEKNIDYTMNTYSILDGSLEEAGNIVARVYELTVQGASGTYSDFDRKIMGDEVNELLNELVTIANQKNEAGYSVFSGEKIYEQPFRTYEGNVKGADALMITDVDYMGGSTANMVEIDQGTFMPQSLPGNQVFWAEQQIIMSQVDTRDYVVTAESVIVVDDHEIVLQPGDNIRAVISKINDSGAAVKAVLDPVKNSLVLETTAPHQIWLQDKTGNALKDLGLVSETGIPPLNTDKNARISGGSLFDMVIFLRDALYQNNIEELATRGIKGIKLAFDNILYSRARLGTMYDRMEKTGERLAAEKLYYGNIRSQEVDLDVTEAITELKMLEFTHETALRTAGMILRPTLLDYLR